MAAVLPSPSLDPNTCLFDQVAASLFPDYDCYEEYIDFSPDGTRFLEAGASECAVFAVFVALFGPRICLSIMVRVKQSETWFGFSLF